MVRKTKEEAEQTRKAILDSALDVFCTKGYSRTTFDDVAANIDMTKGAVYWHFKSKADLLAELIKDKFYQSHGRMNNSMPVVNDLKSLKESYSMAAKMIKEDKEYRKFLYFVFFQMEWSEAMINKIGDEIRDIRDYPLRDLKDSLNIIKNNGELPSDINVEGLALVMLHLWKGALADEIGRFTKIDFVTMIEKGFDLVINGAKKVEA